jgi:prolyl-tRNA synthetase
VNFITGANKKDVDTVNVNIGRDFTVADFADFVQVKGSFKCAKCGGNLREETAIEAGNIFKLGRKFTDAVGFTVTSQDQKQVPVIMGCYGIGNTRLVGTIVEACHDENGIIWPKSVAPYHVHLLSLGNDEATTKTADKLYNDLLKKGIEVIYDDRNDSAGVKFKDADLIGLPLRLVISKRTLEKDCVEWKGRKEKEAKVIKISAVLKEVQKFLSE